MKNEILLYCFPYSEASASFYLGWSAKLDERIKIIPVEYPGRGSRFGEKTCDSMDELAESVLAVLKKNGTENCAFFGHSLGGLVAFEVFHKLKEKGESLPRHLFLSGSTPPHIKYGEEMLHLLPDNEFLMSLVELGGMNEEVMNNRELIKLYLPVIRSDYRIYELYEPKERDPLHVDFTVLTGSEDVISNETGMTEWNKYTDRGVEIKKIEGNHFFIHDHPDMIARIIEAALLDGGTK